MQFIKEKGQELKSEFYIPYATNILVQKRIIKVKVLESSAKWFGVTYSEDKPLVKKKLAGLVTGGHYPEKIW